MTTAKDMYDHHLDDLNRMRREFFITRILFLSMFINDVAYQNITFSILNVIALMIVTTKLVAREAGVGRSVLLFLGYMIPYGAYPCAILSMFVATNYFKSAGINPSVFSFFGPNRKAFAKRVKSVLSAQDSERKGII